MTRQEYNRKILNKLFELVEKHPYLRFGQLLVNCNIIEYESSILLDGQRESLLVTDPFNEESEITWNKMKNSKLLIWGN